MANGSMDMPKNIVQNSKTRRIFLIDMMVKAELDTQPFIHSLAWLNYILRINSFALPYQCLG